ncbi:MAG: sigma 54-interacting transcriptional regulator [Solibacillus sp.]
MKQLDITNVFEFITEKIDIGLCAIDNSGRVIVFNKKMRDLTGESLEQVTQRFVSQSLDFNLEQNMLQKVFASEQAISHVKQTFWNDHGEEVSLINDYYPFTLNDGTKFAIQFSRDVTHQEFLMDRPLSRYGAPLTFDIITAVSKSMKQVIQQAKIAAFGRIPVMLVGESGTGKDMIAEGIHHELVEKNDRFITLICRRNEETLLTQIEKYIAEEKKYTFFAERIEYLSMPAQERIIELLESHQDRNHVFIASIGEDPIDLIQNGRLSKNLYYLFSNLTIQVPSLRERREDIKPFIDDYFARRRNNYGIHVKGLAPEVEELFLTYDWPGNLKELEVLLDDISALLTNEEFVDMTLVPAYFKWKLNKAQPSSHDTANLFDFSHQELQPLDEYMRKVEDHYIQYALQLNDGNISQTAKSLGIHRQGLQYRLKRK